MNEMGSGRNAPAGRIRVLVFCRPYIIADFRDNVAPVADEFSFSFLTDGVCPGTRDTRERFYAFLKSRVRSPAITAADEDQIRLRCRLLNKIDAAQSAALIHAMANTLSEELDRTSPHVILSQLVDEYVTHTLAVLAAKRGITMINYFMSYVPNYVMLTQGAYGQAYNAREPSEDEVASVLEHLMRPRFRQDYRQRKNRTFSQHVVSVGRYGVKRAVFAAKGILERDRWNLHYAVTPYIAERRRLRDFPTAREFHDDWRKLLSELKSRRSGPVVYIPLSYVPEATTNYWIENRKIIDYDNCLITIVKALTADPATIVAVKEHVHMIGARGNGLYRRLKAIPNVISVHPAEMSGDVLEASDVVLLGTGSVGIEATMLGKPVFTYSDTSFWFQPSGATYLDLDHVEGWADKIRLAYSQHSTEKAFDRQQFVRSILRSTVRMRAFGRKWPLIEADHLRAVIKSAAFRQVAGSGAQHHRIDRQ
ncbi:MAG: hypothetical protein IPL91_14635 [Hyphomicrobium sp.]|nr:hypothetical protein [Hyphomicrobium sp.]